MKRAPGFTLLEVLIAVALLGAALIMVVEAQAANAIQTQLARDLSVGAMLAREKMGEIEIEIRKKQSFEDLDEDCGHGDFAEQGYPQYDWECKNEPIQLDMDPAQLLTMLESIANGEAEGGLLQMAAEFGGIDLAGFADSPQGQLLLQAFPLIAETLAQAIRRVTLTVSWEFRGEVMTIPVVLFLTDPTRTTLIPGVPGNLFPPEGAPAGLPGGAPGGRPNPIRPNLPGGRIP